MPTTETLLDGISSQMVDTPWLRQRVLTAGPADGVPVVLIHGNVSAARFWEETLLALPAGYRGLAPDLRGYGATAAQPIDATRGLRDWADDLAALATALDLGRFHLVGWSMGAGVAMQYTMDHPEHGALAHAHLAAGARGLRRHARRRGHADLPGLRGLGRRHGQPRLPRQPPRGRPLGR